MATLTLGPSLATRGTLGIFGGGWGVGGVLWGRRVVVVGAVVEMWCMSHMRCRDRLMDVLIDDGRMDRPFQEKTQERSDKTASNAQ